MKTILINGKRRTVPYTRQSAERPWMSLADQRLKWPETFGYRHPSLADVVHRFKVEGQAPGGLTLNDDFELSHPEVTRWYVQQFEKLNHLKRTA